MKAAAKALFFLLALFSPLTRAGLLRLESETLSSLRNDENSKTKSLNYEYLGANYVTDKRNFEMNSDIGFSANATDGRSNFDLYLLNASYKAVPDRLTFYIGRDFDVQHSVRAAFMDAGGMDLWLWQKRFKVGVFAGTERKVETRMKGPEASVFGAYGQFQTSSYYPFLLKTTYLDREDEHLGKLAAHKAFAGSWSPEVLADSETNLVTGNLNRLEGGYDCYPTLNTALRWRALTYDAREEDGLEQPLFSIFSQGRLYESTAQIEHRFNREYSASLAMGYDNYVTNRSTRARTDGVKTEGDLRWSADRLAIENSVYYLRSYGGYAWGDRFMLSRRMTDRMQLHGGVEVTRYAKVTNVDRYAFSSLAGASWRLMDRFRLSTVAEFNSNNIVNYECRAMAKLVYVLWAEP